MTTTVISLKGRIHDYGPTLEHAPTGVVYVGRTLYRGGWRLPGNPLFNPYNVGAIHTRDQAIDLYREHLLKRPDLLALIPELRGRTLACWCAPEACHADVLVEFAENPPTT
ncbi:DUF4326 domain-containing protein [Streptomyces fagopyri]